MNLARADQERSTRSVTAGEGEAFEEFRWSSTS